MLFQQKKVGTFSNKKKILIISLKIILTFFFLLNNFQELVHLSILINNSEEEAKEDINRAIKHFFQTPKEEGENQESSEKSTKPELLWSATFVIPNNAIETTGMTSLQSITPPNFLVSSTDLTTLGFSNEFQEALRLFRIICPSTEEEFLPRQLELELQETLRQINEEATILEIPTSKTDDNPLGQQQTNNEPQQSEEKVIQQEQQTTPALEQQESIEQQATTQGTNDQDPKQD
jgi:hypothetical protein